MGSIFKINHPKPNRAAYNFIFGSYEGEGYKFYFSRKMSEYFNIRGMKSVIQASLMEVRKMTLEK